MKFLKSDCGKVWLFDAHIKDGVMRVGLACFLPFCAEKTEVVIKGFKQQLEVPKEARSKSVPVKICNARLLMLF